MPQQRLTRRAILHAWLALPAAYALAACTGQANNTATQPPTSAAQPDPASAAPPPTAPPPATAATATATPPPRTTALASVPPSMATVPPAPTATRPAQAAATLAPTPECGDDDDDPTPAQTEGPYYTPNTPQRASLLEPGMVGTRLILTGQVLSTACTPVARALIDIWQADHAGQYDNVGFRLRGHLFTDDQGRYTLETIIPGLYPGRTRHIHVKVQAPNRPILTTQLYFPGEPGNARDGIYRQELLLAMRDTTDGKAGTFDFVLDV